MGGRLNASGGGELGGATFTFEFPREQPRRAATRRSAGDAAHSHTEQSLHFPGEGSK
jgi:hypothetical protein